MNRSYYIFVLNLDKEIVDVLIADTSKGKKLIQYLREIHRATDHKTVVAIPFYRMRTVESYLACYPKAIRDAIKSYKV